jgi:DNA-binding GntR family transcriptional regulator
MKRLQQISRGSLSAQVYEQLKGALMSGLFEPGQRITIVGLAEKMGTSVTPVREAIFQLVADGALELQKAQSVIVPSPTEMQIAELKTIRILLEGEAASVAAAKATIAQVAEVSDINESFFASLRNGDPHQASEYNREFHLAVARIAEMPTLLSIVEMLWARMGPIIHHFNIDLRENLNFGPDHNHYGVIEGLRQHAGELARISIQNDIRFPTMLGTGEPIRAVEGRSASAVPRKSGNRASAR